MQLVDAERLSSMFAGEAYEAWCDLALAPLDRLNERGRMGPTALLLLADTTQVLHLTLRAPAWGLGIYNRVLSSLAVMSLIFFSSTPLMPK